MRATADNPGAAALQGVNVGRVRLIVFIFSGAMAALAGTTIIPVTFLPFTTVIPYAVADFVAAVTGALGSNPGAVPGGLLLELLEGVFSRCTSGSIAAVALLILRPAGLFGRVSEVRR